MKRLPLSKARPPPRSPLTPRSQPLCLTASPPTDEAALIQRQEPATAPARSIGDIERNEIIAALGEVFASGVVLERSEAIRQMAYTLGFARTCERLAAAIDSALLAAVNPGVLKNERGLLSLDCRTLHDYPRELLTTALLAALGCAWIERNEAIKACRQTKPSKIPQEEGEVVFGGYTIDFDAEPFFCQGCGVEWGNEERQCWREHRPSGLAQRRALIFSARKGRQANPG